MVQAVYGTQFQVGRKQAMTSVNVFGQRICDKNCPAYHHDNVWGEFCGAKLDWNGRVNLVDGKVQYGMLCNVPIGFRIVVDDG